MKKFILQESIIVILILFALFKVLYSFDSSAFTVKIKNFNPLIYKEHITRYSLTSSNRDFFLINTHFQKTIKSFTSKNGKTVIIEAGKNRAPLKPVPESKYLKNTRFLNLDSEKIKSIAGKFKSSKNIICDVEHFVNRYISKKILGIPLLPAEKIAETRSGDCTEHTILTVAILRYNNIPARALVGIYLAENFFNKKNLFVYHMWAEAFYKNRWHLVDATRPDKKSYNRYIALAYHNLQTEMPLSYLKAVSAIQDLIIEYRGGK